MTLEDELVFKGRISINDTVRQYIQEQEEDQHVQVLLICLRNDLHDYRELVNPSLYSYAVSKYKETIKLYKNQNQLKLFEE